MAKENEDIFFGKDMPIESPEDVFAIDTSKSITESDVFVGNEEFHKALLQTKDEHKTTLNLKEKKHYSTSQKVLALSILVLLITLIYVLLKPNQAPLNKNSAQVAATTAEYSTSAESDTTNSTPSQTTQYPSNPYQPKVISTQPSEITSEPVSLIYAGSLYQQKNYTKAFDMYKTIVDRFSMPDMAISKEDKLLRDLCRLNMAFCINNSGDYEAAYNLFRKSLQSTSPAIKAFACYKLCFLDIYNKQYKKARTRAYQALAMADAVEFDQNWILAFKSDCHFLIAQAMTMDILSLSNADKNMPESIWGNLNCSSAPFINIKNEDLIKFLNSGSEELNKSLFTPRIEKSQATDNDESFTIICRDCSTEELMSRLASIAKLNISWTPLNSNSSAVISPAIRSRPVTIYTPTAPSQQIIKMAAGCASLLAKIDDSNNTINICELEDYKSLNDHISLLNTEAINLWKSFLLNYYNDNRVPNAHFALAKLLAIQNNLPNAIAEFKLTATRFDSAEFAPFALLNSSILKSQILDYTGAGQDLEQLTEQYPDSPVTDLACLQLAEAYFQTKQYDEASKKFQKVYYISPNRDYQIKAALGNANSLYEQKNYENAELWFNNYFKIVKEKNASAYYQACYTFGQTSLALNKNQQACEAFKLAIHDNNSKDLYFKTLLALIESYIKEKDFVTALKQVELVPEEQFSPLQYTKLLLIKSKLLRNIGLTDQAQYILNNKTDYISDPQFKSEIMRELSLCYISQGNLAEAEKTLSELITIITPGDFADQVKLELAQVLFDQNKVDQTLLICNKIVDSGSDKNIVEKASKLASNSYKRKDDYNNAAAVLLKDLHYTQNKQ